MRSGAAFGYTAHPHKETGIETESLSDSCRPAWVTLQWDPLRGARDGVTSALQLERKTSNTRPVQPAPPLFPSPVVRPELCGGPLKTVPAVGTP